MSKFYQHFSPEDEIMGKVVTLKYIDDISDDDFIMYYFSDGSKCNKEYIGDVDVADPITTQCVMVEILSPAQKWTLSKKTIEMKESFRIYNEYDQKWYDAPGESINVNTGENMSVARDGAVRMEATGPQLPRRWKVEPDEDYLLSLHPELEYGNQTTPALVKAQPQKQQPKAQPVRQQPVAPVTGPVLEPAVFERAPVDEFALDDFDAPVAIIDVDSCADEITFTADGEGAVKMSKRKLLDMLFAKAVAQPEPAPVPVPVRAGEEIIRNENVLIKSMIEMSRKKMCQITMDVVLELPPREVYETLRSSYTDELAREFVESLTARYRLDKLLESLSDGLEAYYNDSSDSLAGNTPADSAEYE